MGYAKENLNPFPTIKAAETITIPNGQKEYRNFEILEDYSLFYFIIEVITHDLTIKLNYLGDL